MHTAICFRCGIVKIDPFARCVVCKTIPRTLDEFVYSEALTTRYIRSISLDSIGQKIRNGDRIAISSQEYSMIIRSIELRIDTMPLALKSMFGIVVQN